MFYVLKLTVKWIRILVGAFSITQTNCYSSFFVEAQGAEALDSKSVKDKRNPHDITVETFASRLESPRDDWGLLPAHSRETTPQKEKEVTEETGEIGFFSGNPFVEITKGILHLYKEELSILCGCCLMMNLEEK